MTQHLPTVSIKECESRSRSSHRFSPSDELIDVALIDGKRIVAVACMGLTQWHELVRNGKAPQPVIRQRRFTRWRVADIRAWLEQHSAAGNLEGTAK
jgi:predicted DNA-binding transcriptional regulator AlpA